MRPASRRSAFTLMELLIVMMIISILLSFILVAAVNATRAAQERATQALISKLDSGLGDRLDAIMSQRVDPSNLLPGITNSTAPASVAWAYLSGQQSGFAAISKSDFQRAGVLARYDQVKAEVPDVFVVQDTSGTANYPLNFAMTPYPVNGDPSVDFQSVYPTGSGSSQTVPPINGLGIWGTTYAFLTGINKNLGKYTDPTSGQQGAGCLPQGYNGIDDDNDGMIDDVTELGGDPSITTALTNHKHVAARAEALYALLVEGQGPYGSVFNRDDFTNNEVKDTDQDGLPEFVDGWGNPVQFYRWPIFYHSDVQRGLKLVQTGTTDNNGNPAYGLSSSTDSAAPYGTGQLLPPNQNPSGALDAREQDPLDQNQQLSAPNWWSGSLNTFAFPPFGANTTTGVSGGVTFFQTYFHQLVEPLANSSALGSTPATYQRFWDRSASPSAGIFPRRVYYTRFLILSAGPDGNPGTPYLTDSRFGGGTPMFTDPTLKTQTPAKAAQWMMIENQAAQATLNRSSDGFQMPQIPDLYTNQLQSDGLDDITNHNLSSSALPVQ